MNFLQELVVFNSPPIDVYILLYYAIAGKNGQIPLFKKYFEIYHFF